MKRLFWILNLVLLLVLAGCEPVTPEIPQGPGEQEKPPVETEKKEVKEIDIKKETVSVDEFDMFIGDTVTFTVQVNDDLTPSIVWESSNVEIATVDNGLITAVGRGTTIITAYVKDYPYISDSVYINATGKIEQKGVGKGTKDDPIFLGNEGEEAPIEVYFIEMQHIYSDSIFIKKGNVEILIDAGYEYDGEYIDKILTQYCTDDRLDLFMASHSDGDHIDGIAKALQNVDDISLMVDYGGVGTKNVLATRNKYIPKGMMYHSAYDCVNKIGGANDVYYLTEDFYFEVLNTGSYITNDQTSASNPHSVAVIFYYKNFTFFTAGDITTDTESKLLKNEDLPEVTLYKASHHGSHGSNSQEFLDTINPKAVAISAARANQYNAKPTGPQKDRTYNLNGASGHPAAAAIERIYKTPNISQNLNVYWNAVNGTMKFTSYGKNDFEFTGSTPLKGYYDLTLTNGNPIWNEAIGDFENKVTGEENFKLHQTKVFVFRDYIKYLPEWARKEYFPEY